ncbi:hypothetical protein [Paraglaciecola sp. MB-3u-78]|uniref:hypothetical protein n=1 Tax=Paraglaciecola sp. MB-3u-78 TaxID=2058332 RepID=UPI0012FEB146|nr:hypothetical protein [Paraglaciecola sp. MB-3u-78]
MSLPVTGTVWNVNSVGATQGGVLSVGISVEEHINRGDHKFFLLWSIGKIKRHFS